MQVENNFDCIHVQDSKSEVKSVIKAIIESGQEDSFFVYDVEAIVNKYENWKKLMPRIETYYAVKCNDNIMVLKTLAALGCGFDCASKDEIRKIISLGVQSNRIIYANPFKAENHIKYAAEVGVEMMTFDSEIELYKTKKFHPNAKMVLRIKYDDVTNEYNFGKKFGCDHKTEPVKLLELAQLLDITVIGVCFHIRSSGSKMNGTIYTEAITAAAEVFDVAATLGIKFNFFDIGGGYPGELSSSIDEIATGINAAINKYFPDPSIKIISEPGQYYVASAFTLAARIHCKKSHMKMDGDVESKTLMYYVNTSIYSGLMRIPFGKVYYLKPLTIRPGAEYCTSTVWGQTCDGGDYIAEDVQLPEMEFGDWIVIEDTGAYTLSIVTTFNGFPTPKIHTIVDEKNWLRLKNKLPMEEKLFVVGNSRANLRSGLD